MHDAEGCGWAGSYGAAVLIYCDPPRLCKACVYMHPALQLATHVLICSCVSPSPPYREELQALQANAAEAADDSMEISTLQLQLDQAEQDQHQLQQVCPPLH